MNKLKKFIDYLFKKTITRWEMLSLWGILYILCSHYLKTPLKFEAGYESSIVIVCIWILSSIVGGFGEAARKDLCGEGDKGD